VARKSGTEVEAFLRRPDPRFSVVLLYGQDAGLVHERARSLARAAVPQPDDPFQLIRLDGDDIADDRLKLADEAHTIGLFGAKRVIWLRVGHRNLVASVEPLLAAPPQDALVVIEAGDLAARAPLRVLIEKAATAMALPCFMEEGRDLVALIDRSMAELNLTIEPDARDLLVSHLGSDRLLSRREIEKVALYAYGGRTVHAAHVEAVAADATALAIDSVVDAVFLGQAEAADRGLTRLLAEGEDAGMLIGALLRHALTLHHARLQRERGASSDEIETTARIFVRRKAGFRKQLTLWSITALDSVLATLREAQAATRRQSRMGGALASRAVLTIALAGRRGR
jgi:DNA polymerase III subunit delta